MIKIGFIVILIVDFFIKFIVDVVCGVGGGCCFMCGDDVLCENVSRRVIFFC